MPTAAEALGVQGALKSALDAAVDTLSLRQTVQFELYRKVVVSEDLTVFWVATGTTMTVDGSLHYATDRLQDEDQTIAANQVILTAEAEIEEFNITSPNFMWIGSWPVALGDTDLQLSQNGQLLQVDTAGDPLVVSESGASLLVAFSRRGDYFGPADLWHYSGFAVYPALSAQIISSAADLPAGPIVSNSLPIWLTQNSFAPVYPSFLVPDNVVPPYVVAHIEPSQTNAIQSFPHFVWPGTEQGNTGASPLYSLASSQLMSDRVRLTLYGFNNAMAIQFYASLMEYSLNTDAFGFQNMPAIRDEKRTQVELSAIAQKKTIEIIASYYQSTADAIARRLILSAMIEVTSA